MKRYSHYVGKYKIAFILAPFFMLSEVFGEIWLPKLMSLIINNGVANRDTGYILRIGLVMLAAVVLMIIGGTLGNYFAAKARAKKLAQEAAKVNYEIDNEPEETPFWKKHHLPEVLCYIVLSTITYMIASSLFLNFIAFVAKNYIRYNM